MNNPKFVSEKITEEFNTLLQETLNVTPEMQNTYFAKVMTPFDTIRVRKLWLTACRQVVGEAPSNIEHIWNVHHPLKKIIYHPETFPEDSFFEPHYQFHIKFTDQSQITSEPWLDTSKID